MNQRTLLYLLIAFVLFFTVMQLIGVFLQRPAFEVVYYRSRMEYDYSGAATFTTMAGLFFKDPSKQQQYLQNYKQSSLEQFKQYFAEVSKRLGRQIEVISMESTVTERSGILEVMERAVLSNVAVVEQGKVDTSLKDVSINAVADSEIVVVIPEDAVVLSVEPTPVRTLDNQIYWKPAGSMTFPRVVFKKGESR
ncbi:MAG: DUF4897 domain-containing protein [Pseudothermotoga sp.]|uniref:DUF4897 domain-containing protein n=1 Tax=Pseudothermotoga sp. TaxID=2033661 RepID=UPI000AC5287A|nr:DUF4897 domain-containing protein [Pseudothermotoga sp.]MDK2923682.1 hypothetical protein [Pseudothermotoga sp.]HBT40013.1 DUF4897 domain-containing protein [Pseudothermotoga sp.]HCO98444.1 DUF4897 domain-containing protein [Pseudothermotoga sp.]